MLLTIAAIAACLSASRAVAAPSPTAAPSVAPSPVSVPSEIVALVDGIRAEKARAKRIELLGGLIADVKKRVSDVPENIGEEDVPRVQLIYELHILLGTLKPETMNPANCPNVLRAMKQMTNPSGVPDAPISPPGRLALDVVSSVCAP